MGAEKEAQARQESLEKKVDQAIREYDDLCKPGGKDGLTKTKKVAKSSMKAAAEAAAVAMMAACRCGAIAAQARAVVGTNPSMFGQKGRRRLRGAGKRDPKGDLSGSNKGDFPGSPGGPETETEEDTVAAATSAEAEDAEFEAAAHARAEVRATQEQFSEARRGKGTTPWQLKFEHLLRDRDQIGEQMARRREVKKKRKAVEKEETKKMFADFEEGVSKEEARREARREAREEARKAAKKSVKEVQLPILNCSGRKGGRDAGRAMKGRGARQQKAKPAVAESQSLPVLPQATPVGAASNRLARALAMM